MFVASQVNALRFQAMNICKVCFMQTGSKVHLNHHSKETTVREKMKDAKYLWSMIEREM